MKQIQYIIAGALVLSSMLWLTACGDAVAQTKAGAPPLGSSCKVQFRPDALGLNTSVSPLIDGVNGTRVSVAGKLKQIDSEWVVIQDSDGDIWIPRNAVLLIKTYAK